MKSGLLSSLAVAALVASCAAVPPPSPMREIAFVANAEGATVTLFDVADRRVIRDIDINPGKARIDRPGAPNYAQDTDVSPDGRTLYVSRGYLGDVAAFDVATGRLLWTRSLRTVRADHMTLTRDGRSLFVSALVDNKVYRIDAGTGAITGEVVTGVYPHDNQVSKDGRRLINTSIGDMSAPLARRDAVQPSERAGYAYQMTIADADTLQVIDRVRFANGVRPWKPSPDERLMYAQFSNEHSVTVYDLVARRVVRTLQLPVAAGVTSADYDFEAPHHGLAITADGQTLCIAGRASDYAALVRTSDLSLASTVKVGDAPGWSEVSHDGSVCLLANTRSDDLSVISIREGKEIARVKMGDGPKHITVADVPADVAAGRSP